MPKQREATVLLLLSIAYLPLTCKVSCQVVVDLSRAASITDMRGSRIAVMSAVLQAFIRDFFDQNPLSHLGLVRMRNGFAERLTELSGSPVGLLPVMHRLLCMCLYTGKLQQHPACVCGSWLFTLTVLAFQLCIMHAASRQSLPRFSQSVSACMSGTLASLFASDHVLACAAQSASPGRKPCGEACAGGAHCQAQELTGC